MVPVTFFATQNMPGAGSFVAAKYMYDVAQAAWTVQVVPLRFVLAVAVEHLHAMVRCASWARYLFRPISFR